MRASLGQRILAHKYLYLMVLPVVVWYIVFCYVPIYGIQLVFKTFNFSMGITGSPWNNFQNFKDILSRPLFFRAFRNTCLISLGRLIVCFPAPIILALLLNEISRYKLKRVYQTILTFPHFLSWIVMSGIIINMLNDRGIVNQLFDLIGLGKNQVLYSPPQFVAMLFITDIWKEAGWGTIVYLAAITAISPEVYEAAVVDGANRWQQLWSITWPEVRHIAVFFLILAIGGILNENFDQIFNLYNGLVMEYADVIDTYVYRTAFTDITGFGYSTTVGFTKSIIGFALLFGSDRLAKKHGYEGIL
jgi:putative aldouronate transport system permease protein